MASSAIGTCNCCRILFVVLLMRLVVLSTCRPISKDNIMLKAEYEMEGLMTRSSNEGGYKREMESKGYEIGKSEGRVNKVGGGLGSGEINGGETKVNIKGGNGEINGGETKVVIKGGDGEIEGGETKVNIKGGDMEIEGRETKVNIKGEDVKGEEEEEQEEEEVPRAMLVFGDSTVDAGTNKHLLTISRSDFTPYGRDLPSKQPTGRFCNGRLVTDYLASMMGLQAHTIAYLDMKYTIKERVKLFEKPLKMEVSFASASSGIVESTAQHFNALPLSKQLEHFKEYRETLIETYGYAKSLKIMERAIFLISTGTNDFLNNYFLNPYLRARYNIQDFQALLLDLCTKFIQDLYNLGARKIGVVSLPPFGCLPAMITLYMHSEIGCVEHLNQHAIDFNKELQGTMHTLQKELIGLKLAYMDSYNVLMDSIQNPKLYGLEHTTKACCGSGKLEVALFCNKLTIGTCEDATSYIFWDSFHLTDSMNQIMAVNLFDQLLTKFHIKEQDVNSCEHVLNYDI